MHKRFNFYTKEKGRVSLSHLEWSSLKSSVTLHREDGPAVEAEEPVDNIFCQCFCYYLNGKNYNKNEYYQQIESIRKAS